MALGMAQVQDLKEQVILVDEDNQDIGTCPKIDCHERGLLHRAFSIFLFTPDGQTLVQRRAHSKYHSGGAWANTCCGHPRPGEPVFDAANRRLGEELGMAANLTEAFHIRYRADVGDRMVENEYVHVFVGLSLEHPDPNPLEACDFSYQHLEDLKLGRLIGVAEQTAWLRHYLLNHYDQLVGGRQLSLKQLLV